MFPLLTPSILFRQFSKLMFFLNINEYKLSHSNAVSTISIFVSLYAWNFVLKRINSNTECTKSYFIYRYTYRCTLCHFQHQNKMYQLQTQHATHCTVNISFPERLCQLWTPRDHYHVKLLCNITVYTCSPKQQERSSRSG